MSQWMVKCPITSIKGNSGGNKLLYTLKRRKKVSEKSQENLITKENK